MREIKFRAWDKSVPTYAEVMDELEASGCRVNWEYVKESSYLRDAIDGKYPLMQYTGLKDKNGVEIYEGDIVRKHKYNYTEIKQTYGVIEYQSQLCAFLWVGCGASYVLKQDEIFNYTEPIIGKDRDGHLHTVEVIGNIYENKELLEGI